MIKTLSKISRYFKVALDLRDYLKEIYTPQQCRETIRKRIAEREQNFLNMVETGIFKNRESPYLKLLMLAGCEFGDIQSSVSQHGIEETLRKLHASEVYLTYDEFKGRKEVIRGGKSFRFQPGDFNNPSLYHHLSVQTGGTTGDGVRVLQSFEYYAQLAAHRALLFEVHGLWEIPHGIWYPILPGIIGVYTLLQSIKVGKVPEKWFSPVAKEYIKNTFMRRFRTNWLIHAGRLWGTRLPKPEFVDLDNAAKIAKWVAEMIRDYSGCCVAAHPSSAVRICHAAKEKGLDIKGTKFLMGGEPITAAKLNEIETAGARAIPIYAFAEGGTVGYGCANPVHSDEIHFQRDSLAVIQYKKKLPESDLTVDAFLFSSLLPMAPKTLLNVDIGDYGVVESRQCGCEYEEIGFDDHIHSIRSYAKLNSEGLMVRTQILTRLIEEVLPSKYGGNSTDYQIVEEEDGKGLTRLNILVSPRVGEISEEEILNTVYGEFKREKRETIKSDIFSQAGTFRVKRLNPISTEMGKILPLHMGKRKMNF